MSKFQVAVRSLSSEVGIESVFSLAAALGMATLPPALAITDDYLIIPGQSIGQTHLGSNGTFYLNKLPEAAASDNQCNKPN